MPAGRITRAASPGLFAQYFLPVGQQSFRDLELEHDFKKALAVFVISGGGGFMR